MTELPLTGGCNCGAVRYEVTEPLVIASYCHCRRCQRRSGGAASPNAHPAEGAFRIVKGHDRLKQWKPEDGGEKWFCGDCGSSMLALLFVALDWTDAASGQAHESPLQTPRISPWRQIGVCDRSIWPIPVVERVGTAVLYPTAQI